MKILLLVICAASFLGALLLTMRLGLERAIRYLADEELGPERDAGLDPCQAPQLCRQCGVLVLPGQGEPILTLCGACLAEGAAITDKPSMPIGVAPLDGPRQQICAWCGKILQAGEEPASHGICRQCAEWMLRPARLAQGAIVMWPACSRCRRPLTGDPRKPGQPISHGLCPECAAKVAVNRKSL